MLAGRWSVDDITTDSPIFKAGIEIKDVLIKIAREDVSIVNPSLADVEAKLKKVIFLQSLQQTAVRPTSPLTSSPVAGQGWRSG
jgi:C-terminal processing protease CtpA/Prc